MLTLIIIIFGALIGLAGLAMVVNPEIIFGSLQKHADKIGLHGLAVITRLVLGAVLVLQSGVSRYPAVIEIIGWLAIIAAVILSVIGRNNFKRLMAWAFGLSKSSDF